MKNVIAAAKTLKEHCKTQGSCAGCELYRRLTGCTIGHSYPNLWETDRLNDKVQKEVKTDD